MSMFDSVLAWVAIRFFRVAFLWLESLRRFAELVLCCCALVYTCVLMARYFRRAVLSGCCFCRFGVRGCRLVWVLLVRIGHVFFPACRRRLVAGDVAYFVLFSFFKLRWVE